MKIKLRGSFLSGLFVLLLCVSCTGSKKNSEPATDTTSQEEIRPDYNEMAPGTVWLELKIISVSDKTGQPDQLIRAEITDVIKYSSSVPVLSEGENITGMATSAFLKEHDIVATGTYTILLSHQEMPGSEITWIFTDYKK